VFGYSAVHFHSLLRVKVWLSCSQFPINPSKEKNSTELFFCVPENLDTQGDV
jgi:hypothetical protein